jgi:hypothetical protein
VVTARVSSARVSRNYVLWTLVLFFGASVMFAGIRDATRDEGVGVALAAQATAGVLLVVLIILIVKRRG